MLEVRCRSRKRTEGGGIERAASHGEEGDGREPASDLEDAAGDVLVRDAVCGEVSDTDSGLRRYCAPRA